MTQGLGVVDSMVVSANFGRLVLGSIEADFCNQILFFIESAFFEIYKIYRSSHRSKFKIVAKLRQNFSAFFLKLLQHFGFVRSNSSFFGSDLMELSRNFAKFQICQNLSLFLTNSFEFAEIEPKVAIF